MIDAFRQTDLRRKILITLGILVLFRFIAHVPVPGADPAAMQDFLGGGTSAGSLFGMLDLFSGSAMRNMSIASLGVYPYITATIIMQLMVPVIPKLRELSREGDSGRAKINIYTHWLTVPLAMLQGYSQLILLQRSSDVLSNVGFSGENALPTISMILAMVAGTMFLVWLGELITEYGIGNGVSLIIFAGIVCTLPNLVGQGALAHNALGLVIFCVLSLVVLVTIIIFTEAQRRIPVQYARSLYRGGKVYRQSGGTHIPIRVNSAGMIPIIFAMSFLLMPGIIAGFFANPAAPNFADSVVNLFSSQGYFYWILYFFLVVALTFFYTTVIFQQQNLADTLQKQGAFIPGIRPGKATHQYLSKLNNRITWGGAIFLGLVTISPFIIQKLSGLGQAQLQLPAIGMIIVVGVALDTMRQLEAQLLMRNYEGFLK
ncbi:MAG: preprotein translocase subunit SecY [Dehalococcoidia bacterium]|jgi:preprotein translocase subunit SecY